MDMMAARTGMGAWPLCMAVLAGALFAMLSRRAPRHRSGSRHRRARDRRSSQAAVDHFLRQMAFRSVTDYDPIRYLQIDVLKLEFLGDMMPPGVQCAFFTYAQELDLSSILAVMKLCIWLEQHNIAYAVKFGWCGAMPAWYNIKRAGLPKKLRKALALYTHDQIMEYDLAACTCALKPKDA